MTLDQIVREAVIKNALKQRAHLTLPRMVIECDDRQRQACAHDFVRQTLQ
jgi:hypothetical protein